MVYDARGLSYPQGLVLNKEQYIANNPVGNFFSTDIPGGNISENYVPSGEENIIIQ